MALGSRRRALAVVVILAAGAIAWAAVTLGGDAARDESSLATASSGAAPDTHAPGGNEPPPVHGALVIRDTLVISITARGQAAAWRQIPLTVDVGGRIAALPYRENDFVEAGAVLLAFDTAEFAFNVASANTRLKQAQANYRAEILTDYRITDPALRASRDTAARMKSGLAEAEIQLQRARMEYERVRLRAPFSGRIANVRVVPGQRIGSGTEVMTIMDVDPVKVEAQVSEAQVGAIARGRRVQVTFAAFPDDTFTGRVETMNPLIEEATRTARVTVLIGNPRRVILPGMYAARVTLEAVRLPDRLLVPRQAVLQRDGHVVAIYRAEGDRGIVEWRKVTLGQGNAEYVEIIESRGSLILKPGEIVLVDGHHALGEGAVVRLVNQLPAAGNAAS